jgi:maltose alpha-D-glucosyltransferase/alpha-amylase
MIRMRKERPVFGWGTWHVVETGNSAVLAHCCTWQNETVLTVHNFSEEPQTITIKLPDIQSEWLVDLLGGQHYTANDDQHYDLDLAAYGYHWFRVE